MLKFLNKYQNTLFVIFVALVAFLIGSLRVTLFGSGLSGLSGAAGAMANEAACDTSILSGADPAGIVLADPLNMRVGPGLGNHVVTLLDFCTPVSLVGRNSDATWLQVQLPGNVDGWVFAYYIQANVNLNSLEDTTGFGGEYTAPSSGGQAYVSVIIQTNYAAAFVTGMPANEQVSAILSPTEGAGKSVVVSGGWTDADGNITLTFIMPEFWADGSPLKSGTMHLTILSDSTTLNSWITYYTQ